jgi:predicted GNAT superfamily acetyltransferase
MGFSPQVVANALRLPASLIGSFPRDRRRHPNDHCVRFVRDGLPAWTAAYPLMASVPGRWLVTADLDPFADIVAVTLIASWAEWQSMSSGVKELHDVLAPREELLRVNNANARDTSLLTREKFDRMIGLARVATFIESGPAFLLAFEQNDDYDGAHFLWFRSRFDRFLYIDRIVVAQGHRRLGVGHMLYVDLFRADRTARPFQCRLRSEPAATESYIR